MTKHQRQVLTAAAAHERGNVSEGFAGPNVTTLGLLMERGYIVRVRDLSDAEVDGIRVEQTRLIDKAKDVLARGDWKHALGLLGGYNGVDGLESKATRKVYRITTTGREALQEAQR